MAVHIEDSETTATLAGDILLRATCHWSQSIIKGALMAISTKAEAEVDRVPGRFDNFVDKMKYKASALSIVVKFHLQVLL
ncbi:hypothetical protein [Vibrio taketomensis]|uniref:hypothetical protein n=1 Tax=Vibrio taketomensis TaxID=2572923 RepID=UPI00138999CC|nr:hypothetical protein [Vibrio taketomensis]